MAGVLTYTLIPEDRIAAAVKNPEDDDAIRPDAVEDDVTKTDPSHLAERPPEPLHTSRDGPESSL